MTQQSDNPTDVFECERCGQDTLPQNGEQLDLADTRYLVCRACAKDMGGQIERYHWFDRYTEEHHEKAVETLRERDEILCIDENYASGEIWVHTNYVDAGVVRDVMDHFGFNVYWWGPRWAENETYDCLEEHGSCFEICLSYDHSSKPPLPVEADVNFIEIDYLEESDKQF